MFLLSPNSPQMQAIARLYSGVAILSSLIFLTIAGLVCYSLFRYRAREEAADPPQNAGSKRLEMLWTALPVMLVLALFTMTVRTMAFIDAPRDPARQPDLTIIGHQWWWEARYPNGAVTANEIHVPIGRRLLVQIDSADVIHDFWAPELARKIDAVPGFPSYIWLEPNRSGIYQGACAEFCGTQHAWMRFAIVAEPEATFSVWLKHQSEPAIVPLSGLAAEGARLFQQEKCGECHAIAGTEATGKSAPDLTHVASRQILGAGISRNTPQSLSQWINEPQKAKPGNHMPDSHLSEQQTQSLLAYLETLR